MQNLRRTLDTWFAIAAVIVVASLAGTVRNAWLTTSTTTSPSTTATAHTDPWLPSTLTVRVATMGFDRFVSDLIWMRLVNYVGSVRNRSPEIDMRAVYPLAEFVTDLDPTFVTAYQLAGLSLTEVDSITRHLESTCLFRKGRAAMPDNYQLKVWLAYNLWSSFGENKEAAQLYLDAAEDSPVPELLAGIARRLVTDDDHFSLARGMLLERLQTANSPMLRSVLRRQLARLDLQSMLLIIDSAADAFATTQKRRPSSIDELVTAGLLPGKPADPTGGEIILGKDGKATSTKSPGVTAWKEKARFADVARPPNFRCREKGDPYTVNPTYIPTPIPTPNPTLTPALSPPPAPQPAPSASGAETTGARP